MKDSDKFFLLAFGVGIVALVLLTRRTPLQAADVSTCATGTCGGTKQFRAVPAAAGRRYVNTETTEIEWNSEMLPVKITRHRDAVQN